jgi:inhibitor of KinA sporulation pathway (predicted exonuclease)
MRTKLDKLLIVDIEATCWESKEVKPSNEVQEIIEIGICTFDLTTWKPLEKSQILVKPTMSIVSKYCTDLTGWTQEVLENYGVLFSDACKILTTKLGSKKHIWASWGDFDRLAFERDCQRKDVKYPFNISHFNLKIAGLEMEGTLHKGVDDAWNIGRILKTQGRF